MGHNVKGLGHFINCRGGGARVKMSKQLGLSKTDLGNGVILSDDTANIMFEAG